MWCVCNRVHLNDCNTRHQTVYVGVAKRLVLCETGPYPFRISVVLFGVNVITHPVYNNTVYKIITQTGFKWNKIHRYGEQSSMVI
jgi:hypothetical protein